MASIDLEELMTILFEYVFKIPPFINYSYDMCDYIHQFFIDFTDKEKKPTVHHLLQQSLALQDNLKLRSEPNPALILQMPNSDDGIIHYEAVLPSVSLNITPLLENATGTVWHAHNSNHKYFTSKFLQPCVTILN